MSNEPEWTPREYRLKAIEIYSSILPTMATQLEHVDKPYSNREAILLSSMRRAPELSKAVMLLESGNQIEEMYILMRSLAELVLNACFFQFADLAFVNSYLAYDVIAANAQLRNLEAAAGRRLSHIPEKVRENLGQASARAEESTGLPRNATGWGKVNVVERAAIVDKEIGGTAFSTFTRAVFQYGNTYVHANSGSLEHHLDRYLTAVTLGTRNREDGRNHSLLGVIQALGLLSLFVNTQYQLGFEMLINVAHTLTTKSVEKS